MIKIFATYLNQNFKRFYIVIISLALAGLTRFSLMGNYQSVSLFTVHLSFYFLLLALLLYTGQTIWERLYAKTETIISFKLTSSRRKYYGGALLFSIFMAFFVFTSFEVNRSGDIVDQRAPLLLATILIFNLIVILFSADWTNKSMWKQFLVFLLGLGFLFLINAPIAILIAIAGSKGGEPGFQSGQLIWIQFFSLIPISFLLLYPHFKVKLYSFSQKLINSLGLVSIVILGITLILMPAKNNINNYLTFLQDRGVLENGEILSTRHLDAESRLEIVDRTQQIMATINDENPAFLLPLETDADSSIAYEPDAFAHVFGFDSFTLANIDREALADFQENQTPYSYRGKREPELKMDKLELESADYLLKLDNYTSTFKPNSFEDIRLEATHPAYTVHFHNDLQAEENAIQLLKEGELVLSFDFQDLFEDFSATSKETQFEDPADYTYVLENDLASMTFYFDDIQLNEVKSSVHSSVNLLIDIKEEGVNDLDIHVDEFNQTNWLGLSLNNIDKLIQLNNAYVTPYLSEEESDEDAKPYPFELNDQEFTIKFLRENHDISIRLVIYDSNDEIVFDQSLETGSLDQEFKDVHPEDINKQAYLLENDSFRIHLWPTNGGAYGVAFSGYVLINAK